MALVVEACRAWNTCFAADSGDARLYCSGSKGAQQTRQEAAARDAVGGTSAGFVGSDGQFLEHFKQKDWTYDTILDDGKGTEESIGEDAFDCVACDSLADTQGSSGDKIPGRRTVEDPPAREVESKEGQGSCGHSVGTSPTSVYHLREVLREHGVPRDDGGGQTFDVYCQNFGAFSLIPDPVLEQNTGCDEDVPSEQLPRKLGSERGKEDSSCLCMLHLPSFLWSLCGAFSGRSGKNCEGRQPANQSLALTQGAKAHSVVNTSGMCRGLQGELSFDEPFMPVIAQTVETQHDSCLQECDQVVDAALSQNHRGFSDLGASILRTGVSKDLNHLVTRKGPAVAGELPNCKVDYYCEERSTRQEADPSVPSPCQVPAGEVTGAVQCVCSARSGCQVVEGHELPLPHRSCCMSQQHTFCERSGCQVPSGEVAGALQTACCASL